MASSPSPNRPLSPSTAGLRAESPPTAREPDLDDDANDSTPFMNPDEILPSQTAHSLSPVTKSRVSFAEEEVPPPKPPRPVSPMVQGEVTLIEAFPTIDVKVVKAVLVASGGQIEPAFNALLSMSDPNFEEEHPPPQPPRPTQAQRQLEEDERYARQLAQHYNSPKIDHGSQRRESAPMPRQGQQPQRQQKQSDNLYDDDQEHSFFDDDLPVIRDTLVKGFTETQSKVNKWISDFRKRIDGEDEDDVTEQRGKQAQRQSFGSSQSQQLYGIRKSSETNRRGQDRERYDADPQVLSDDFANLDLRDDVPPQPRRPNSRPLANPDLFKSSAMPPRPAPVDEVEAAELKSALTSQPSPSSAGKTAKWQPLTSVAPNPEAEDNDPFSLGDSDEEREAKGKDLFPADTERLRKASAAKPEDAAAASKALQENEVTGTKDKTMEELMERS